MPTPPPHGAAETFLHQTHQTDPWALFSAYAKHLLIAAGTHSLPIMLDAIRANCRPQRRLAPLPHMGFLLKDTIYVNSDDRVVVQRFTEAHEMMESLFRALTRESPSRFPRDAAMNCWPDKERWCEHGAAELLMPSELFFPGVEDMGLGLDTARRLALLCQTSLTATTRRMLESDIAPCIFLLLRRGYKKNQCVPSRDGQLVLFGEPRDWDPPAELRVWKSWKSPQVSHFVCTNESLSRDTSLYRTLQAPSMGSIQQEVDILDMEYLKGSYYTESMKVRIDDIDTVLALIHLDSSAAKRSMLM